MITKSIYKELSRFRDGPVRRVDGPDAWIEYLVSKELIEVSETTVTPELSLEDVEWKITPPGIAGLEEYEAAQRDRFWAGFRQWVTAFIAGGAFVWSIVAWVLSGS